VSACFRYCAALEGRPGVLEPMSSKQGYGTAPEELETLSRIIAELNERFGLNLDPERRVTLGRMWRSSTTTRRWMPPCGSLHASTPPRPGAAV